MKFHLNKANTTPRSQETEGHGRKQASGNGKPRDILREQSQGG